MTSATMEPEQGFLITRDAHEALRDLKNLVDLATQKIHAAELETASVDVQEESCRRTLLAAAETLRSPKFEAAIQRAVSKVESAVAWHSVKQSAAGSH